VDTYLLNGTENRKSRWDDRTLTESGHIVVAVVDGDFTCKTLQTGPDSFRLVAANPDFADIVPTEGQTIEVWGVVVASIVQHGT
jgi:DNA polymerase V